MNSELSKKIKSKLKITKRKEKWVVETEKIGFDIWVVLLWFSTAITAGILIYVIKEYSFLWSSPILPGFGRVSVFPWELTGIFVFLMLLLYVYGKKISTFYRNSPWIIVGVIILSITGGYFLAEYTGLNEWFSSQKPFQDIYKNQGKLIPYEQENLMIRGKIISNNEEKIIIEDREGQELEVYTDEQTIFMGKRNVEKGDMSLIISEDKDGKLWALFVKTQPENGLRGFDKNHDLHSSSSQIQPEPVLIN